MVKIHRANYWIDTLKDQFDTTYDLFMFNQAHYLKLILLFWQNCAQKEMMALLWQQLNSVHNNDLKRTFPVPDWFDWHNARGHASFESIMRSSHSVEILMALTIAFVQSAQLKNGRQFKDKGTRPFLGAEVEFVALHHFRPSLCQCGLT